MVVKTLGVLKSEVTQAYVSKSQKLGGNCLTNRKFCLFVWACEEVWLFLQSFRYINGNNYKIREMTFYRFRPCLHNSNFLRDCRYIISETTWPRYSTFIANNAHFFDFNLSPAESNRSNITLKYSIMCWNSFPKARSSSKYIKQMSRCNPVNTVSIRRWNIAGALHRPNEITWNWYYPFLVASAVFWRSLGSTFTCQYPEQSYIVENHFAPDIRFKESSILGRGYAFLTVTLLSFL